MNPGVWWKACSYLEMNGSSVKSQQEQFLLRFWTRVLWNGTPMRQTWLLQLQHLDVYWYHTLDFTELCDCLLMWQSILAVHAVLEFISCFMRHTGVSVCHHLYIQSCFDVHWLVPLVQRGDANNLFFLIYLWFSFPRYHPVHFMLPVRLCSLPCDFFFFFTPIISPLCVHFLNITKTSY